MRQRGRKSPQALADIVVDTRRKSAPSAPSAPPTELTDAQAAVWRDVVSSLPDTWFRRAAHPILIQYCRHACRARLLEMQIQRFEIEWTKVEGGLERLGQLLALAGRETSLMLACARALRLARHQIMHPRTAARAIGSMPPPGPRPWE